MNCVFFVVAFVKNIQLLHLSKKYRKLKSQLYKYYTLYIIYYIYCLHMAMLSVQTERSDKKGKQRMGAGFCCDMVGCRKQCQEVAMREQVERAHMFQHALWACASGPVGSLVCVTKPQPNTQ